MINVQAIGPTSAAAKIRNTELNPYIDQITDETIKTKDIDGDGSLNVGESGLTVDEFTQIDWKHDGKIDTQDMNAQVVKTNNQIRDSLDMAQVLNMNNNHDTSPLKAMLNGKGGYPLQPK